MGDSKGKEMIQTKPHEFMVSYTPQRQWIEQGGVKLWLAFFFIELGAGMFFMASLFDSPAAMWIGWLLCAVLGGGLHLLYLGKPLRFWRMIFSSGWRTSWISRGLIFVILFLLFGLASAILAYLGARPVSLRIGADVFAFLTVIYGGFAMNYVNAIPLWNSAVLPILYVVSGLWGGAEVTLGIILAGGEAGVAMALHGWGFLLLLGFVLLVPIYLMSVRYTSLTGQVSVKYVIAGPRAPLFWVVVGLFGMAIPLVAVVSGIATGLEGMPSVLLFGAILSGLMGDLAMRYLILKSGLYGPLIPWSNETDG